MNIPSVLSLKTTLITASVALLIGLGAGGKIGWDVRDADYQKHLVQDGKEELLWAEEMRELSYKASAAAEANRTQLETKKQEVRETTRTITERIPVYVTAKSDAACPLPSGLIELHNQAAGAEPTSVPSTTSVNPDTPSQVTLSQLTGVIVHNYGVSQELEAEALAWRQWYREQSTLWEMKSGASKSGDTPGSETSTKAAVPSTGP